MHIKKQRSVGRILGQALPAMVVASIVIGLALAAGASSVYAVTTKSPNYQLEESTFDSSSSSESCSGEFCARASIGSISEGGRSASQGGEESTAEFGPITPDQPSLDVIVDPGVSDLGVLDTESTAYKTSIIRVRSYLSNGYFLQITGDPPKYNDYTLATPSTPTASDPGTEQFAINVAPNTTPDVGALPQQRPSSEFSYGYVNPDYLTPNLFMYESTDVVAQSDTESGRTDYTVSMIINISNATPAGRFEGDYSAVVIPSY